MRSDSFTDRHIRVPGQLRSEGILDGSHRPVHLSLYKRCRFGRCQSFPSSHDTSAMNNAASRRRLARPVRLTLASELGDDLDGAWWPYTASLASELPGLVDALIGRLGHVIDISVNWSSLAGSPALDALILRVAKPMPRPEIRPQRVMVITGRDAGANLMVVPYRTTFALAVMVLRQAAALPIAANEVDTETFRTADTIVRAARVESALQRMRTARPENIAADEAMQ